MGLFSAGEQPHADAWGFRRDRRAGHTNVHAWRVSEKHAADRDGNFSGTLLTCASGDRVSGMRLRWAAFLLLASALAGQAQQRRPRGIYAVVNVQEQITNATNANPSITPAQLEAFFLNLYQELFSNPAISGVALYENWAALNPNAPPAANAYDWTYMDDLFAQAAAWNTQNPSMAQKTVQLVVPPGFQTPAWVMSQIPSCDTLFQPALPTPASNCGKATFSGFVEGGGVRELPMPWNSVYKTAWQTFLTALAARYLSNPAFVSIALAGPTASSEEMILPDNGNSDLLQTQFGGSISPNTMWIQLLTFHYTGLTAYQKSLQGIIDEWKAAIDMFGQIFSGVTLVTTTGDGLPNLAATGFTVPSAFATACPNPDMDCAAETTILSYFLQPAVGGANAKSVQEDGLEASRLSTGNLGAAGIRLVSQMTAQFTTPTAQILGGLQFGTSFANFTLKEGCTSVFPPDASDTPAGCSIPSTCTVEGCIPVACIPQACLAPGVVPSDLTSFKTLAGVLANDPMGLIPPEQAEYNVLSKYFDGTPAGAAFGMTTGLAPMNYLQIYAPDILYASNNINSPAQVVEAGGVTVSTTAQALLNLASANLLKIGEPLPSITLVANAEGEGATIAPNTWVEIKGLNLAPDSRIWQAPDFTNAQMPAQLDGVGVTVNGKSAYVYYISPAQVNILTPPDAMQGSVQVQVTNDGATSAAYTVTAQSVAPSFFVFNGGPYVAATHVNGSYLGPTSLYPGLTTPAARGETVVLYANGFGSTSMPVVSGSPGQSGTLSTLPVIKIGGIAAAVQFAGLVAPGEFQFNVVVPPGAASGDNALTATYNGASTQGNVLITIQ